MIDQKQDLDWCLVQWRNSLINSDETFVDLWREHMEKQHKAEINDRRIFQRAMPWSNDWRSCVRCDIAMCELKERKRNA